MPENEAQDCPFVAQGVHAHIGPQLLFFPDVAELRAISSILDHTTILVASNIKTPSGLTQLLWAINQGLIFLS